MNSLKPFISFYGSKWRAAPYYDPPKYSTIIEPFCGGAGYSLRYPDRNVILVEKDPKIYMTWDYLINVSEDEISSLPDIQVGQSVDDLPVCPEAKLLIGWWLNSGSAQPCKTLSSWGVKCQGGPQLFWGARVKARIVNQLKYIRHWKVIHGSYTSAPDLEASWFIDPPYQKMGQHYTHSSKQIDFSLLASWCQQRRGQVIVCENVGAAWLPFKHFKDIKANESKSGGRISREAIWTNY